MLVTLPLSTASSYYNARKGERARKEREVGIVGGSLFYGNFFELIIYFLGIKHLESVPRFMVYGCFSVSRRSVVRVIHRHEKCVSVHPKLLTHAAASGGAKFHGGLKLTANFISGSLPTLEAITV